MHKNIILLLLIISVVGLSGCTLEAATSGHISVREDQPRSASVNFSVRDREIIADYFRSLGVHKNKSSGLVRYDYLPRGIAGHALPGRLEKRLSPLYLPYGRLIVGADVILINRNTRIVVDILYDIVT